LQGAGKVFGFERGARLGEPRLGIAFAGVDVNVAEEGEREKESGCAAAQRFSGPERAER